MKWVKFDPNKRLKDEDEDLNGEIGRIFFPPEFFEDFPNLKGMWVPTYEEGTHGSFDAWAPAFVDGCVQVWETKEEYLVFNPESGYYPVQICELLPEIGIDVRVLLNAA